MFFWKGDREKLIQDITELRFRIERLECKHHDTYLQLEHEDWVVKTCKTCGATVKQYSSKVEAQEESIADLNDEIKAIQKDIDANG